MADVWIRPNGEGVPAVGGHLKFILDNKGLFSLTQDDCQFAKEHDVDGVLSLYSKVWFQGWIYAQIKDKEALHVKGFAALAFWKEYPDPAEDTHIGYESVHLPVGKWLRSTGADLKGFVTFREEGTMRTQPWIQPIGFILNASQHCMLPKHEQCYRCGRMISHDEIIHRGVCPKCGFRLV